MSTKVTDARNDQTQGMLGAMAEDVGKVLSDKATAIAGTQMRYIVLLMPDEMEELDGGKNFLCAGSDIPAPLLPEALEFFAHVLRVATNTDDPRAELRELTRPKEH